MLGACLLAQLPLSLAHGQTLNGVAETPLYQLQVGQQLRYSYDATFSYQRAGGSGTQTAKGTWDVWVLDRNEDQSWTVVLVQELQLFQKEGLEQYEGPKQTELLRFEIHPDGRINDSGENFGSIDPRMLFPALPVGEETTWNDPQKNQTLRYRRLANEGKSWSCEGIHEGLIHDAILKIIVSRFEFAATNDRVETVVSDVTIGYGTKGEGRSTIRFVSSTQHPPEMTEKRFRDSASYFAIVEDLRSSIRAGSYGQSGWKERIEQSSSRIAKLLPKITEPPYANKLRELQGQFDLQRQNLERNVEHRKSKIGKPGAQWSRKDFSGRERTSEEFKGQVTVLAFWNRANNWSIRMLPGMKNLARSFAGKPVTFLSMNNDRFRTDADFVLQRAQLPFPTIQAAGLSEQYGVRVYPAVVVLTAGGALANFHEGYTKFLIDDVRQDIDALLEEGKSNSPPNSGG